MLNTITIMGRMVRDPEIRKTGAGTSVLHFTLAVDRDYADDKGNRETDFIDCVAWAYVADFVGAYFSKGDLMAVNGRLQLRDWEDDDGNRRRAAEIKVGNVYFGGGRRDNSEDQSGRRDNSEDQSGKRDNSEDQSGNRNSRSNNRNSRRGRK